MPTYEYQCKKCDHLFERFQNMSDPLVRRCPKCKGAVRRLLGTGAGIIFKGSGFYETDYRRKTTSTGKTAAKSETPKSDSASTGAAKSSDTGKPAASKT